MDSAPLTQTPTAATAAFPRKGILLAGGRNTRLHPCTLAVPKSLLPVYDKPMIYYPLALLMQAGIQDILIITTADAQEAHRRLLGGGERFGIRLTYAAQMKPRGIADAFLIAQDHLRGAPSALALSDTVFHGRDFSRLLQSAAAQTTGATILAHKVDDPRRFGVAEFNAAGRVLSLEEKPAAPKSSYAVPGLYFYDQHAPAHAAALTPSARGELEITDLNQRYLQQDALTALRTDSDATWFDAGTPDSLLQAAAFIQSAQQQQNTLIGSPEQIARQNGWLSADALAQAAAAHAHTPYGARLQALCPS